MSYEELHTALMWIHVKLILEIIMGISNNMFRYTQFSNCHYGLRIYNIAD